MFIIIIHFERVLSCINFTGFNHCFAHKGGINFHFIIQLCFNDFSIHLPFCWIYKFTYILFNCLEFVETKIHLIIQFFPFSGTESFKRNYVLLQYSTSSRELPAYSSKQITKSFSTIFNLVRHAVVNITYQSKSCHSRLFRFRNSVLIFDFWFAFMFDNISLNHLLNDPLVLTVYL